MADAQQAVAPGESVSEVAERPKNRLGQGRSVPPYSAAPPVSAARILAFVILSGLPKRCTVETRPCVRFEIVDVSKEGGLCSHVRLLVSWLPFSSILKMNDMCCRNVGLCRSPEIRLLAT
jgi:hypothetical protein